MGLAGLATDAPAAGALDLADLAALGADLTGKLAFALTLTGDWEAVLVGAFAGAFVSVLMGVFTATLTGILVDALTTLADDFATEGEGFTDTFTAAGAAGLVAGLATTFTRDFALGFKTCALAETF